MTDCVIIPLKSILKHANPLEAPPWPDLRVELDPVMVDQAYCDLLSGRVDPDRYSQPLDDLDYPDGRHHAGRIAWLALNGWEDTISIDATDIDRGLWPVTDGNHRLAAAVYLGDISIEAEVCGFEADIIRHFGEDVARQIFNEECLRPALYPCLI